MEIDDSMFKLNLINGRGERLGKKLKIYKRGARLLGINSSHLDMFFKIGVLKNFAKFTGTHLSLSICFNPFAASNAPFLCFLKKKGCIENK